MNKSKKIIIITFVLILLAAILVIMGIILYKHYFAEKQKDTGGVAGVISDGWDSGVKEESSSESAGIQIPGYSTAKMKAGDKILHLSIGNPETNSCGFYATLKLKDGTVLYKSELLEPGYGLTEIPLSQTLESGEYNAVVFYECVTLDDKHSPLNSAESEFKLIVTA